MNWLSKLGFERRKKVMLPSESRELYILSAIQSKTFSSMRIQDQIVSLSRIVALFQQRYGFMPYSLAYHLTHLNHELNVRLLENGEYSA